MSENNDFITQSDREALERIAAGGHTTESKRAAALLALSTGQSRAEAAESSGLTEGQVSYAVRKFREQGITAFESFAVQSYNAMSTDETAELRALVESLNAQVAELQQQLADRTDEGGNQYSPVRLLILVRDSAQRLTPDMQLDVLRNFEGMSTDDLRDIETWKGLAYMMTYSARFQAGQMRDRMAGTINQVVPEPVQPGRLWQVGKRGLDRLTPDIAKQILSTFEGATREDLLDPDTWKGVWYMINYSLQFQAEQLKQHLMGTEQAASSDE